jgi:signal transduction histidine kinase
LEYWLPLRQIGAELVARLGRLRTQLILSHLIAIVITLLAMVAAVVLLVSSWLAAQQTSSLSTPTQEARTVATALGGAVARGDSASDLNVVLRLAARGDLGVPASMPPWAPQAAQTYTRSSTVFPDVAYIVIVGPDRRPLASSESGGARFAPPERGHWDALAAAALSANLSPRQLVLVQPSSQPAALGAYPILDSQGKPIAAVIIASRVAPSAGVELGFWQSLRFFATASAAVLAASSIFALLSAGIVGYLLSRRLVIRLEQLGDGVEALAAGDLSRRIAAGPADEVGQLARRFNQMAERLATSVAELALAKERAEDALRAKRELVANVSHELRTPLALIRSHVEALRLPTHDDDPSRQREYLAIVERESDNLGRLIDDLFALSTAEAGALPLNLETVALGDVAREVADGIAPIARRERQIAVVASVGPDLPPVRADRRRVVQVLGNLVRNSLRYTPEGGLIAVHAERSDGRVEVSVEDTGEGIPPERLPHIFERFYRGDDSRDRASGGAGLGLAIVRELVEAMGGDVSATSIVGQGSRFSFRLPVIEEPGAGSSPRRPERQVSVEESVRIPS